MFHILVLLDLESIVTELFDLSDLKVPLCQSNDSMLIPMKNIKLIKRWVKGVTNSTQQSVSFIHRGNGNISLKSFAQQTEQVE